MDKKKKGNGDHLSDMDRLLARFDNIDAKLAKIEVIETKVSNVEVLLKDLNQKNKTLNAELALKEKQLCDMQAAINQQEVRINHVDQYHQNWSAQVVNVPLTGEEEQDVDAVVQKVYNLVLLPILNGAKHAGQLRTIPTADQLLEVAHVLPGKPGNPKPIIMRFFSCTLKAICFRFMREYVPREPAKTGRPATQSIGGQETGRAAGGGESSGANRGRYAFPLHEDLTRANLAKLKALSADPRTQSCWSINGVIKFKLVNSSDIRKVGSILNSQDTILG
jgi:hypothetical protein